MIASLARAATPVALALASFLTVSSLVRRAVPWPDPLLLRPKMEAFEREKDDVDVVLIGSSRTFRGIAPDVLDERLAARGHPLRSWNLAVGGMRRHEAAGLLRRVLERAPPRLRVVLIEWGPWEATFDAPRNVWTDRSAAWHDATGTRLAIAGALELDLPISERLGIASRHAALFLHRLSAYGRGGDVLRAWTGRDRPANPTHRRVVDDLIRRRGYRSQRVVSGATHAPRFAAELDRWREEVADIDAVHRLDVAESPAAAAAREAQFAAVRAAGAEPIVFTGPGAEATPGAFSLERAGRLPTFFPLNSPNLHPALYLAEHHFERLHLNDDGAAAASRILADLLADHLERSAPPRERR